MRSLPDFLLLAVLALNLYIVGSSRMASCVRAIAVQGALLALFPLALWSGSFDEETLHVLLMSGGAFAVKAVVIPWLLYRALREANVQREVEPYISYHLSLLVAAILMGISFWLASAMALPLPVPTALLVPVAFATVFAGFLVLVSRRKAITQVMGYLMLENGIFIFGQTLVHEIPFTVELGILLDLLVGVFVMGIAIHHINREFDHIDTELLSSLKD